MSQTEETPPKKDGKRLLKILLYLATALFVIWLLALLYLMFYIQSDENEERYVLDKLEGIADLKAEALHKTESLSKGEVEETNKQEIQLEQLDRDEFNPAMKNLLKNRNFDKKRFDAIFENMKTPQIPPRDPLHSTFGKEVVYIYHSHSRESFLPYFKDTKKPEDAYHSKANITIVGKMLGKALGRRGIGTEVDSADIVQELSFRGLGFNSSYKISGERVKSASTENKDLEIFLDIHRDSLRRKSTTKEINGDNFARLLFVIGTGHENYTKNLQFTEGLDKLLSTQYPGLSKGIITKDSTQGNGVYNQDMSPNAVIVEIGGVDNTLEELKRTTEALADVLSDYYWHREK
ncbi:stage II sporulation protein P [Sporosarcina siberiensis]|uniref:Stage II sporulation protein P n=1 Tax=Sporosarcina siberiensis TaxID=1365606 RepID=A0ABW4SDW6_9BACL